MIVTQLPNPPLDDVRVIKPHDVGFEIETPRYRTLTHILQDIAAQRIDFVDIYGNQDILFTAVSPRPKPPNAVFSFPRQGYGDYRHLIAVRMRNLAQTLRDLPAQGLVLEHVHD